MSFVKRSLNTAKFGNPDILLPPVSIYLSNEMRKLATKPWFASMFKTFFCVTFLSGLLGTASDFAGDHFELRTNNDVHLENEDENILDLNFKSNRSFFAPKINILAELFRKKIERIKSHLETELIILVDGSSSIGETNFKSEMKYIQKVVSDVNLGPNAVRLAVLTYSSSVTIHVNHLESETEEYEKCSLLHYNLPNIKYEGGATNTRDALLATEKILTHARPSALKVVFLVTDGFSNRGNPVPVADRLKRDYVAIYTFGIENGNVEELRKIATRPFQEHSYLFESFDEFEGFERRALHQDLKPGAYVILKNSTLCDQLCDKPEEGSCCVEGAKCTCGRLSGHFACLCPPGYYGNGLRDQGCKPCPNGTYNDGTIPGDVLVCLSCPDRHQITKKQPATSIDDCACDEGYIAYGNKCEVISCPELSPPKNGYFVKKNCSNVLNAACGVRCHMGFTLSGSSIRICQKNGTWSGVTPFCAPKRCESLPAVPNSDIICVNEENNFEVVIQYNATGSRVKHFVKWPESKKGNETTKKPKLQEFDQILDKTIELNYTVDTECTFSCSPGYFLVGSRSRSCLPMLRWSGLKNTCKAIKCHSLQKIENGIVSPENCTNKEVKHSFAQTCHYFCDTGYELKGPNVTNCTGRHGTWSRKNSPSKCIDVEAPKFTCPLNLTVPTDEGVHFATLQLSLPNATDNSGKEPVIWSKPPFEKDYALRFIIGESEIQIYGVDDTGNYAFCSFNVIVEDRESPTILECESPPVFFTHEFPPNSTEIKWKEPVVDDNSGVPIPLRRNPPISEFPLGTTTIVYTAEDYAGNNASCTVNITILENPCSERPEMTNTLWNCTTASDLIVCNVSCPEGFAFSSSMNSSNLALNCTYSGRKAIWSPDLFKGDVDLFPECSETEIPTDIEGEIVIDGSDDLCDDLDQLSNEISNEISTGLSAEEIPILMVCEDESSEENKEEKLEEDTNVIRKKRMAKKKKLKIGFSVKGKFQDGKKGNEEVINDLTKTKNIIRNFYTKQRNNTVLNYTQLTFKTDVRSRCKDGSLLKGNICVKCPKGTYHNKSNSTCDPCPLGQYQEVEGQLNCTPCSEGYSTRKIRRKHSKQCKKICPPGTFGKKKSKAGIALAPCTPCLVGFFQPLLGQTSCEKCPEAFITPKRGSVRSSDCIRKTEYEDLCFHFNCRNGGSCFINDGFAVCKCPPGFLGSFCERSFDPCGSSPCYNGGKCVVTNAVEYECKCIGGFEGVNCESEVNECLSNPCGGHGECIDLFDGFRCNCFSEYKGENCSERISHCEELQPCLNSGTCVDLNSSYMCLCTEKYTGSHCEEPFDCYPGSLKKCEDIDMIPEDTQCGHFPCGENRICIERWNRQPFCACKAGYRGENCSEVIDPHVVLHFPKYGVSEYLSADFPSFYLTAISICMWIQTKDKFNYGTLFSYATIHTDNSFTLTDYSGLVLYVSGEHVVTDLTANDGLWHFICVTWQSANGQWKIYLDGSIHSYGSGLSNDSFIPGNGKMIVGQEQDFFGGGFNELESFSGRLIYFDVWGRVLQPSEVKNLYENCDENSGDWISWTQLLQNTHGNIQEEESVFCKTCSENLTLFRGRISYEYENTQMRAKYECDEGFHLKFDPPLDSERENITVWYRKCMKYGNWEWQKPICSRISCGFPGYFLSGKILGNSYLFGDTVHYKCEDEYMLIGNDTRICQANGTWSEEVPYCQGNSNECRKLVAPRHGSMFVYFNHGKSYGESLPAVGDRVEFTCDKGFSLKGFGMLTCLEGGVWDRQPPNCQEIKCHFPEEASGLLNPNILKTAKFYFGDSLIITCPSKVRHIITCGEFGTWNFTGNICGAKCLEKPRGPTNGYVVFHERNDSFYTGETLTVKCKPGFILLGDSRIRCSDNNNWLQFRPTVCEPLTCGPPPPPPHPYFIAQEEGHRFGQKVFLNCAPGYVSTGDVTTQCEADGRWSRIQNSCIKKSCDTPNWISGSNKWLGQRTKYFYQDVIQIKCPAGKILKNDSIDYITCQSNGTWSAIPECV